MPIDLLKRFHDEKEVSQAVHNSMLQYCQDLAGKKAIQGEDVSGFKEAVETINKFFTHQALKYGQKKSTPENNE